MLNVKRRSVRVLSFAGRAMVVAVLVAAIGGCPAPPPNGLLDSDGDGFTDFDEINSTPGTDPFDATDNPNNVRDTDGDGCSDYDELNFAGFCNNDPNVADSDGDGFSDDEEINGVPGTDPFDATDNPNSVRDTDGDGCSDFDELNFAGFCNNDPDVPDGGGPPSGEGVVISGTINVTASSVVDGDTNDPINVFFDNNASDLTRVQPLPNPCTVGGFLGEITVVGSEATDRTDVFLAQMAAGQTASLLLADPEANDFDLFLFDEQGIALDSSEGVGKAEQVTAPSNGTFMIEVYGYSVVNSGDAGGLYNLLVGTSASGAAVASVARDRISSLDEFREGEVLIGYREGARERFNAGAGDDLELEVLNRAEESGGVERVLIKSVSAIAPRSSAPIAQRIAPILNRPKSKTIEAVKRLRRRSSVAYADPNYIRHTFATPNDEFYPSQWHYAQIGLPEAWDITTGSSDVIVAVLDTGVVLAHPDLQNQLVAGYDFISDPQISRDGDGIDPDPNDPGDLAINGNSSSFHGTHVSGTIAAESNNQIGVAGVAWGVKVMPVRVLGQGGGTDFDIVQGILYAAGLSNASGTTPSKRADVINMSLGGGGLSSAEQEAITAARAAGVIVVAAAGNESSNANFSSPAGLDGVVTVSALGYSREAAPYSNYGSTVEVAAPGGDLGVDLNGDSWADGVLSTMAGDDGSFSFVFEQGTSMACPHIAGVAALMKSVNPDLTPEDFDLLLAGAHPGTSIAIVDDLGAVGKDDVFGYGLINALGAVRAAAEIVGVTAVDSPIIQAVPGDLNLGSSAESDSVTVRNAGVGTLAVSSVTSSDAWLSVSPTSGGEGSYVVSVDRSGLDDGVYSGTVTIDSNGGSATVRVRVSVGSQTATGGDVGTLYVLLLDSEDFTPIDQWEATAADEYDFSFADVAPGEYRLFVGTDMNNDSFIDDAGEALGGYPTLLDARAIEAYQDRVGVSITAAYRVNVQAPSSVRGGGAQATLQPRLRRFQDARKE